MDVQAEGKHIVVEGQDGAGKSTIVKGLEKRLREQGKRVLNLREYMESQEGDAAQQFPSLEVLSPYDVIIIGEPTHSTTGRYIREVLVSENEQYSEKEVADAFAKDRLELYTKVVLPLLKKGIHIIQDRSVISTIFYQILANPEQPDKIDKTHPYLCLEGNQVEIGKIPDLIIIPFLTPETGMIRAMQRSKADDAKYEKLAFQKKLAGLYTKRELYQTIYHMPSLNIEFINTEEYNDVEAIEKAETALLRCLVEK